MGPPPCQVVVVKSMSSLFGQLRWDPAYSLEAISKYPWIRLRRKPPSEWSFLTSHPMFPLWVVQLLPTSPDLPL